MSRGKNAPPRGGAGWRWKMDSRGLAGEGALGRSLLRKGQAVVFDADLDGLAFMERPAKDLLGQGVLEEAFDRPAHRSSAVLRVVALGDQEVFGLFVELEHDVPSLEPLHDLAHFEVEDLDQIRLRERAEH